MYVRNLPFKISSEELYDIFGKYGAVYQIRFGDKSKDTRGTAFVGRRSFLVVVVVRMLYFVLPSPTLHFSPRLLSF